MLLPLMLLAAGPETAVEAERAFNRAAQTGGQWAAFRDFSTPDAIWFTPQPAKVHDTLPDKEPAIPVQWWPAESYVSCDGSMAVNTGPWVRPKGDGYFTTVWVRHSDGRYKWVYDGGDALATPRPLPEEPRVRRASCAGKPVRPKLLPTPGMVHRYGQSVDGTLGYYWVVKPDGARTFVANLWNGKDWDLEVIRDDIAAAPSR